MLRLARCCLLFYIVVTTAHAGEVLIAVAADATGAVREINAAFEKAHPGAKLQLASGSSGNLFAQIDNGAPFDVFLSADTNYPRELAKAGFAVEASIHAYARGRIVLWTTRPGLDVAKGLALLRDSQSFKKVAIANPSHAPYGRAAKSALEHEKLWDELAPRLVLGENVSQAAQFVQTGNADAGIVALSQMKEVAAAKAGNFFLIPQAFYPPLDQGSALLKHGADNPLAKEYLEFLNTSPAARKILDNYGFGLER